MKYFKKIAFLFFCGLYLTTTAQEFDMMRGKVTHDDKSRDAIVVTMEPGTKDVKKAFKDYMDDRFDVKMKGIGFLSNKDVLTAEGVTISDISNKEMDLYAKVVEEDGVTRMSVFGSYGYDLYLNPTEWTQDYRNMRSLVYGFISDYLPAHYSDQVNSVQERLGELRDDREDIQDEIAENESDIEKKLKEIDELKKENENMKKELVDLRSNLEKTNTELDSKRSELDTIQTEIREKGGNK